MFQKDQLLGAVLKPLIVGGSVGHGMSRNQPIGEPSVRKIGLEQGTRHPGAKKQDADSGDHRVLGARSVGRLST
jgi:hypothetical protein